MEHLRVPAYEINPYECLGEINCSNFKEEL